MSERQNSDKQPDPEEVHGKRKSRVAKYLGIVASGLILPFLQHWDSVRNKSAKDEQQRADERLIAAATSKMARYTGLLFAATLASVGTAAITAWILGNQLGEMRAEQRPWIGVELIQSDNEVSAGKPFHVMVFVKNFGHSPSTNIVSCIGSDTPNIRQRDALGIANMMAELSTCQATGRTILMPNGDYGFDVSRTAQLMTDGVAADINGGLATFATFGRLDYTDSSGKAYWTTFCALYVQRIGKFNACDTGNEAH
jgi:hypothetical protein